MSFNCPAIQCDACDYDVLCFDAIQCVARDYDVLS